MRTEFYLEGMLVKVFRENNPPRRIIRTSYLKNQTEDFQRDALDKDYVVFHLRETEEGHYVVGFPMESLLSDFVN